MSDDKQLSGMVVCDHCPDFAHPLNDDGTKCINPRPASPTPKQPAQGDLTEDEIVGIGIGLSLPSAQFATINEYARRLLAEVKRRRALAPPAQTQRLTGKEFLEEMSKIDLDLRMGEPQCLAVTEDGHRCSKPPHETDEHEAENAAEGGADLVWVNAYLVTAPPAQTQQGLSREWGAAQLAAEVHEKILRQLVDFAYRQGFHELGYDVVAAFAEETRAAVAPLNPDKQPSPSAAPAQERKHTYACNSKMLADEDAGIRDRVCICAAPPASPEGALREALDREAVRLAEMAGFRVVDGAVVDAWINARSPTGDVPNMARELLRARAALAGQPAREEPINQCDGCRAGRPIDKNGNHRMGDGDYPNLQACQQHLYSPAQPAREDDQKALRAAALEEAARLVELTLYGGRAVELASAIRALAGSPAEESKS